jgi:hypothetical protein
MSEWQTFRSSFLLRACCVLIVAGTLVALSPLIFGMIHKALEYGQREAGYHCAGQECSTDEADARLAFFTWVLALVTGGLVAVTGALFLATYGLYRKTSETLEHARTDAAEGRKQARELFTAERRPWIQVRRELVSPLQRMGSGGLVQVRITLENIGLSPAFDVAVQWWGGLRLRFTFQDQDDMRHQMETLRANRRPEMFGRALFPRDPFSQIYIAQGEIMEEGLLNIPTIAGWVSYRFTPNGPLHFTPFVWQLPWRPIEGTADPDPDHTFLSESNLSLPPD